MNAEYLQRPAESISKRVIKTALFILIAFLQACSGGSPEDAKDRSEVGAVNLGNGELLRVVATTNIVGDVVSNVGGDAIELTVLIEAGQDPHSFEPTPSTLAAVERAEVIFANGFDLEESLLEDIETAAKIPVTPVSTGIEPLIDEHEDDDRHGHGAADPHVWFDPTNVIIWVDNIEEHLVTVDPSRGDGYHIRAGMYRKRLEMLDQWIRRQFSSLPADAKKLVTDHRMFGYFADEYGFEIIGTILPGLSTSADASARSITDLVKLLEKEKVFTIFVGSTAGRGLQKLADTVASELGEEVRIIEMLTGSLSVRGELGDSYIGYMEYNIGQIVKGLFH